MYLLVQYLHQNTKEVQNKKLFGIFKICLISHKNHLYNQFQVLYFLVMLAHHLQLYNLRVTMYLNRLNLNPDHIHRKLKDTNNMLTNVTKIINKKINSILQ